MEIWLVRHGQTEENKQKLIQGHLDGKLSDLGILQSKATGLRLEREEFDNIYVSDLGRTRETLRHLISSKKTLKNVTFTPLIREKNGGVLEGKKSILWETQAAIAKTELRKYRCENSESWEDVMVRAELFMKYLISNYIRKKEETITKYEREAGLFYTAKPLASKLLQDPREEAKMEQEQEEKPIEPIKRSKTVYDRSSSTRKQRIKIFENEVAMPGKSSDTKKILVVTHGGFIMELFNVIAKKLHNEQPKLQNETPNCSISVLRFSVVKSTLDTKLKMEMVKKNDIAHLKNVKAELCL